MNIISVQPITDRPIIDAIAPDDFMLIGDASDNNVVKRVLVSSLKSFFTAGSPTPTPTPTGFALRINCGGNQFTDFNGNLWIADQYFSGGQTYDYAALNIPPVLTPPTLNYLQQLFAQERSGNFNYQIPCENGNYTVNLYFCEVGFNSPSSRAFNISLNGTTVISNFDIFSEVGKGLGMKKTFSGVVANGLMLIGFVADLDSPQINGIEIVKAS